MKRIKFDSVIVFALLVPFIAGGYRYKIGDAPLWAFGVVFLLVFLFIALDLSGLPNKTYNRFKNIVSWFMIVVSVGSMFVSSMSFRHKNSPLTHVHDIILQQEAAISFLVNGVNPYATDYFGTPLEQWDYLDTEENPALYHFVMQPFYLLFSLPFYYFSNMFLGYFDARIPLLFLFAGMLVMASSLVKNESNKRLFLILLALNPAMLPFTLEGRSDVFMFAFMFAGFFLLYKKKYAIAGIPLALSFAVKQSAWPLFPFYTAFLLFNNGSSSWKKSALETIKQLMPFVAALVLVVGPFIVWDSTNYFDSTVFYLSGSTEHSYPINGYGFGKILHEAGFISDRHDYYPFYIWQILVGLPVFVVLLKFLRKSPGVDRLILIYGIFLFIFWYFSRYFNNSHLGFLSTVFITAYFWPSTLRNAKK